MGYVVLATVFDKVECRRDGWDWVVEKLVWDVDGDCMGREPWRARLIGLIGEREWLEDDDDDDGYLWLATIIRLSSRHGPRTILFLTSSSWQSFHRSGDIGRETQSRNKTKLLVLQRTR